MQIIVTATHVARTRVINLAGWQIAAGALALLLMMMGLSAALYHYVLLKGAREGWPGMSQVVKLVLRDDSAQRERYMRENLDAIASKLGELQAKLLQLDAVGDRVSGLAGLKPEDFEGLDAPAVPGRAASAAATGGRGGPYLPIDTPSLEQLHAALAGLDEQADRRNDMFTLAESRLLETRLRALMVPSSPPVIGPVGSGFGFRSDPFTGRSALHTGLDFPAPPGTPILAAAGGVVVVSESHPAYGLTVEIDHGNALVTRYAHASKLLVRSGDLVKRGQAIAQVGSTGRSTGPHLHFEVLVEGVPQNPSRFLAQSPAPLPASATAAAAQRATAER